MLSVQILARRIRTRLHDTDEITYGDEEILDCINCGIRFIRRLIASMRPSLLMSEVDGTLAAGENKIELEFYLAGTRTIHFYPTPDEPTPYKIRTVDDIEELTWEENSPLLTEFDDFLVEYATIRLAAGNEFDMTQESQLMANIAAQIQQILIPPPVGLVRKGYWR